MGKVMKIHPVKLIIGFIFKKEDTFTKAAVILGRRFGSIDFKSRILPFCYTNYYEKEIGKDLKRRFISFKKLIFPEDLPKIKNYSNRIEEKFSLKKSRLINIDPGYLDLAKLVLATTKDYNHRVYLDKGIYAEVTLCYQHKTFRPWDWTYPDYRSGEYIEIFNQIREIYFKQTK